MAHLRILKKLTRKGDGYSLQHQEGFVLGLVMIFFVIFSLMGLAFVKMGSHESIQAVNNYDRVKAFYNAEAGLHKGLWLANKVSAAAATFADGTVSVVYDSVNLTITATGIAGSIQDSIKVTLSSSGGESTGGWPYAIYTDTQKLGLDEGTGSVTGDVHSNDEVETDGGYTISGTITEETPYVAPPTITWSFFQTEATNLGQYSTSDLSFTSGGSPYTGVWYTTGKADIYANAVINGTIVAESFIHFNGDNITITATPANYPVLIAGDQIEGPGGNYDNVHITGLVYGDSHFDKDFNNFTLNGAIIVLEEVHHNSSNFVVTYDATYTTNVAGTDIGGTISSPTVSIATWENLQ